MAGKLSAKKLTKNLRNIGKLLNIRKSDICLKLTSENDRVSSKDLAIGGLFLSGSLILLQFCLEGLILRQHGLVLRPQLLQLQPEGLHVTALRVASVEVRFEEVQRVYRLLGFLVQAHQDLSQGIQDSLFLQVLTEFLPLRFGCLVGG